MTITDFVAQMLSQTAIYKPFSINTFSNTENLSK